MIHSRHWVELVEWIRKYVKVFLFCMHESFYFFFQLLFHWFRFHTESHQFIWILLSSMSPQFGGNANVILGLSLKLQKSYDSWMFSSLGLVARSTLAEQLVTCTIQNLLVLLSHVTHRLSLCYVSSLLDNTRLVICKLKTFTQVCKKCYANIL